MKYEHIAVDSIAQVMTLLSEPQAYSKALADLGEMIDRLNAAITLKATQDEIEEMRHQARVTLENARGEAKRIIETAKSQIEAAEHIQAEYQEKILRLRQAMG